MKVLISLENEYRVYMEALASALRSSRPEAEVAVAERGELEAWVERFDPQLVITNPPVPNNPVDLRLAWIELSPQPEQVSRFRVRDRQWESTNPTLEEILSVVEAPARLL
jgi:hypothetical protein